MNDDERALMMLEKSIYEAREMLEKEHIFRPFAMILDQNGSIRKLTNEIEDMQASYMELHDEIMAHVQMRQSADVIVLLTNATMPDQLVEEGLESCIRVHLEERSQQHKAIASRFIYVPYQLQRMAGEEEVEAILFQPKAISFPSEFFTKED
jgi:hypothetical protein